MCSLKCCPCTCRLLRKITFWFAPSPDIVHKANQYSLVFMVVFVGTPVLTISPTTVSVGQSFTVTCVFQTQPLLGSASIVYPGKTLYLCALEAAGNGTCKTISGTACSGNTGRCSADKLTYILTVNNVNESLNHETVFCRGTINNNDRSTSVQITVLGKKLYYCCNLFY